MAKKKHINKKRSDQGEYGSPNHPPPTTHKRKRTKLCVIGVGYTYSFRVCVGEPISFKAYIGKTKEERIHTGKLIDNTDSATVTVEMDGRPVRVGRYSCEVPKGWKMPLHAAPRESLRKEESSPPTKSGSKRRVPLNTESEI